MRKHFNLTLLTILSFTLFSFTSLQAQDELFANPGFETWQNGGALFGMSPEAWNTTMGDCTQETATKLNGEYALRIKARTTPSQSGKLEQEISYQYPKTFTVGDEYELTFHYYTVTSKDGNDITLKSYWRKGGNEELDQDKAQLNNGTFFTSVGTWGTKTIRTTVPEEATSFYFALKVSADCEVIFDDFSFKKVASDEPSLTVQPQSVSKFTTKINEPKESGDIVVLTENLPGKVYLSISGKNRNFFSVSAEEIPAGQTETKIRVTYNPTTAGNHEGLLLFDCVGKPELNMTMKLTGQAIDPANPPTITVNTQGPVTFNTKAQTVEKKTISVSSKNIYDYLYVKVVDATNGAFKLSTTLLAKNEDNAELEISFEPLEAGTYTQRLEFYSQDAKSVFLDLQGTATENEEEKPKEGDDFPLDTSNPVILLNEHFDEITSNEVLSIDKWKNIAAQGKRAWWGHEFKTGGEKTAKVTAYDSKATTSDPVEMWLITPALDFKNAQSKVFTFRVMGDLLFENQDARLELCYIDMKDNKFYQNPVDIAMPSIADDNGDWREYHVNLEGQNIEDVFFMGFHFTATGGKENSAVYYIDDVSFGRTDLPTLKPSVTEIVQEVEFNTTYTSPEITVGSENLTAPITLSLGGPNPSKFKLSAKELPAAGGKFTVSFSSDQEGVHQAYVKISSRGAADVYIPMSVNNKKGVGIQTVTMNEEADVTVYDCSGKKLLIQHVFGNDEEITNKLSKGTYIIQRMTDKGSLVYKVCITE